MSAATNLNAAGAVPGEDFGGALFECLADGVAGGNSRASVIHPFVVRRAHYERESSRRLRRGEDYGA